ncbi:hypothetical protein CRUP_018539 [Coryphaenoides rupestris]|nr:hypothetical protein CRUP_018539 [Coryphaenoides rupestris]
MATPGSGRKRAPLKDRFSAEDEALSSIAREAEARLAAKRAARAEARDIRMRELERQQKELPYHSSGSGGGGRKWGQIHQWMGLDDDVMSVRSYRSTSSSVRDLGSQKSRSISRRKDLLGESLSTSSALKSSRSTSSVYNDLHGHRKAPSIAASSYSYSSRKDLLVSSYSSSIAATSAAAVTSITPSSSTTTAGTVLPRSYSMASIYDDAGLYGSGYSSKAPSECSWYSSSTRSSPVSSDDDSVSTVSGDSYRRGRRDSVSSDFLDISESAADYFSRSNRRGSIVSDLDDLSIPDLDFLDDKCDKNFPDYSRPSSRCTTPSLSAATLASLGGTSSRRGSVEAASMSDPDASMSELRDIYELKDQIQDVEGRYMQGLKELKESLSEVEEKYKKAMVSNAQLDNDKANLIYQVDTLKDVIEEMEEQSSEMRRELEDKSKELERQKHTFTVLHHKHEELKEGIRQRDELIEGSQNTQAKLDTLTREVFDLQETVNWKDKKIGALERQKEYFDCIRNERDELRDELADIKAKTKAGEKHGLVIIPEGMPNGDFHPEPHTSGITVVSQEAAQVLESAGEGPLDVRLRKLAEEKDELLAQIRKLKMQLEDERQKHAKVDGSFTDGERLENGTDLHIIEMQKGQVSRYKASADNAEKVEDELKVEKRRLQRELRTALDKTEEMEMTNSHLVKRLEKMKANRNALLSQQ